MLDNETTVADLRRRVAEFVAARDWERFHAPKNLSIAIAVEAAELMEHFQWLTADQVATAMQDKEKLAAVADELADVLIYAFSLANVLGLDASTLMVSKLHRNEGRFPVEEWRGRAQRVEDARGRAAS